MEPGLKDRTDAISGLHYPTVVSGLPKLGRAIPDTLQLQAYLVALDGGRPDEYVHAFFLDRAGRLAWSETLATGLSSSTKLEFRHLISTALRVDARGLILAHNHPSGAATPSARDVTTTFDLQRLCTKIGIELIDHLIVAAGCCYSFQAERLLRRGA